MSRELWNDTDPRVVARHLLGSVVAVGHVQATILVANGYVRSENTGLYEPIQTMAPGSVYCPRRRNAILLLIATAGGSCVLIHTVEVNGTVYDGPGKSSAALGLEVARARGETLWVDADTFAVIVTGTIVRSQSKSPRPSRDTNGIGEATLEELMPRIVKVYMRDHRGETFEQFLTALLAEHRTEQELRRFLRERGAPRGS